MEIEEEIKLLEKEKLKIEISRLKRSGWKKSENWINVIKYIAGAITIGASVFLAWFAYQSGVFDIEKSKLENEKATLEKENATLEFRKEKIQFEIIEFEKQKDKINDSLSALNDLIFIANTRLNEQTLKFNSLSSYLQSEKERSKSFETNNIHEDFKYYDYYKSNKVNSSSNLRGKIFGNGYGFFFMGGLPKYNSIIRQNINYEIEDIFPNSEYIDLDKVAKTSKISIVNDSLYINIGITDTLLIPYASPIIVYIKSFDKIIYSAYYMSRRLSTKCDCSEDKIAININGYKKMNYEVLYGLFHQGSLFNETKPLFFYKKETIEIK